jgi:hypothetical protein
MLAVRISSSSAARMVATDCTSRASCLHSRTPAAITTAPRAPIAESTAGITCQRSLRVRPSHPAGSERSTQTVSGAAPGVRPSWHRAPPLGGRGIPCRAAPGGAQGSARPGGVWHHEGHTTSGEGPENKAPRAPIPDGGVRSSESGPGATRTRDLLLRSAGPVASRRQPALILPEIRVLILAGAHRRW